MFWFDRRAVDPELRDLLLAVDLLGLGSETITFAVGATAVAAVAVADVVSAPSRVAVDDVVAIG